MRPKASPPTRRARPVRPAAESLDARALPASTLPTPLVDWPAAEFGPVADVPTPVGDPGSPPFAVVDPTDAGAEFVRGLYRHELGREADPAELAGWVLVSRDAGPEAVVRGIRDSAEARLFRARSAFPQFLGRGAAPGEAESYAARLRDGHAQEDVFADLLSTRPAATDAAFVADLYRAVLGREAGPGEAAGWEALAATQGRRAVAMGFLESAEFRSLTVADAYRDILGREPDAAGLLGWVGSGLDLESIRDAIWASPESTLT